MSHDHRARTRRGLLRAGGAFALATALSGCLLSAEPYVEETDRSFDPGDAEALAVVTENGDVTLSAGDGDAVSGTVRTESRSGEDALEEVTVEATTDDGVFRIEPVLPDRDVNVSVDLDLSVPADLPVARAESTNGDATVTGVTGDPVCRTGNGDATAEDVDGFVTVRSSNGDVTAAGTTGLAGARTANGEVTADVAAVRDDVSLRSTNGDVTAAVPSDLVAAVELRTTNGDASVDGVELTTTETSETRISGRTGPDPEHTLTLETTNGDVTLEAL